jgi:hypothetical protein
VNGPAHARLFDDRPSCDDLGSSKSATVECLAVRTIVTGRGSLLAGPPSGPSPAGADVGNGTSCDGWRLEHIGTERQAVTARSQAVTPARARVFAASNGFVASAVDELRGGVTHSFDIVGIRVEHQGGVVARQHHCASVALVRRRSGAVQAPPFGCQGMSMQVT